VEPWDTVGRWHVSGNRVDGSRKVSYDNWSGGVQGDHAGKPVIRAVEPFAVSDVSTTSARRAFRDVLRYAGATLPQRDPVDARIINETRTGVCAFGDSYGAATGIIDSQNSSGAWPLLSTYEVQADSDGDGMPDGWELKKGLDPALPADRNTVAPSGYTMLEEYINGLCSK